MLQCSNDARPLRYAVTRLFPNNFPFSKNNSTNRFSFHSSFHIMPQLRFPFTLTVAVEEEKKEQEYTPDGPIPMQPIPQSVLDRFDTQQAPMTFAELTRSFKTKPPSMMSLSASTKSLLLSNPSLSMKQKHAVSSFGVRPITAPSNPPPVYFSSQSLRKKHHQKQRQRQRQQKQIHRLQNQTNDDVGSR